MAFSISACNSAPYAKILKTKLRCCSVYVLNYSDYCWQYHINVYDLHINRPASKYNTHYIDNFGFFVFNRRQFYLAIHTYTGM